MAPHMEICVVRFFIANYQERGVICSSSTYLSI